MQTSRKCVYKYNKPNILLMKGIHGEINLCDISLYTYPMGGVTWIKISTICDTTPTH